MLPLLDPKRSHDASFVRASFLWSITSPQLLVTIGPLAFCRAMYVGLSMRALLMRPYSFSHSSGLRERNMMLLLVRSTEFAVGGERMEMSSAVPRRNGTSGVSSRAINGFTPR